MKKVNIAISVSDELYDMVVFPYKKKKAFGALITSLLEAYAYNETIYNYINDTHYMGEEKEAEELLKDLNTMSNSLNMMGVLQDQAEVVLSEGTKVIKEMATNTKEDVVTRADVMSLMDTKMEDIKSMVLSLIQQQGGTVQDKPQVTVKEEPTYKKVVDVEPVAPKVEEEDLSLGSVQDEDNEREAQSALSSLLDSLQF